eukprot:1474256-Prymnesium_polylepis.1
MGRLTHHNTPGPVGRPRRDSLGHESSPLWEQAGQVGDSASPHQLTGAAATLLAATAGCCACVCGCVYLKERPSRRAVARAFLS